MCSVFKYPWFDLAIPRTAFTRFDGQTNIYYARRGDTRTVHTDDLAQSDRVAGGRVGMSGRGHDSR